MDDDLTVITVHLVPHAVIALDAVAELTGDNRTDCVNRALQLYAALNATASVRPDRTITVQLTDSGAFIQAETRPRRWWRFW